MKNLALLLPLLLPLAACATRAEGPHAATVPTVVRESSNGVIVRLGHEGVNAFTVQAPTARVWEAIAVAYATLGIEAEVEDAAGGVYGTRQYTAARILGKRTGDYLRCGNEGSGASAVGRQRIRATILTTLRPGATPEETSLSTEVQGTSTAMDGSSTQSVQCVGTGELEAVIRRLIAEQVER